MHYYFDAEMTKWLICFLCRWILLETLDKVSPGIVNWKVANKPPIKLPFKKVENCNQVVKIGKQLKFSLVNIAGNDIVQGNKKLILGMLSVVRISIVVVKAIQIFLWHSWTCIVSSLVLSWQNVGFSIQLICGNWWDTTFSNFWRT